MIMLFSERSITSEYLNPFSLSSGFFKFLANYRTFSGGECRARSKESKALSQPILYRTPMVSNGIEVDAGIWQRMQRTKIFAIGF